MEWDQPGERLSGACNLLKAQALAGAGQPRKAAVTLERALLATLDDRERPQMRLQLAQLLASMDQSARALGQVRELLKESPYAREAVTAAELQRLLETKLTAPASKP